MECNLGLNHMHDLKIKWAHSMRSIWNHKYDFRPKLHNMRFNEVQFYCIHFEIAQNTGCGKLKYFIDALLSRSEIKFIHFLGGKSKSFGNKSCKICQMILFVFHFPAIWLVTLNKPWNLIGCFVFSLATSLAGKKMQFKAKNGVICE